MSIRARRLLRWLLIAAVATGVVLLATGAWLRSRVVASLPIVEGEAAVRGLAAPVTVERDARGVPTIRGASRVDVARATGFVHAQDRFFQMDLLRRSAAGELAEIVGAGAIELDRRVRVHRFRAVAGRVVDAAPEAERALLDAYAEGVNAGLAALRAKPFEYIALRESPKPWSSADTILCVLAMFVTLQDRDGAIESRLGVMKETLPPALFAFLAPQGTEWDAPLQGEAVPAPAIPGPDVIDLRSSPRPAKAARATPDGGEDVEAVAGSNNWAVAGAHTAHGGAIVSNDMHLDITVPNIWYRASLTFPGDGGERRLTGVTLPGAPSVIVGSTERVAWGFTNSFGDWSDLVILDPVPGDEDAYRAPSGAKKFDHVVETIRVKGAADQRLDVLETIWGPVIDRDHRGRRRALRWVAHDPQGVNVSLLGLENATTVGEAQRVAASAGIPAQNFVCADREGHIGWTIMGRIPRRVGFDGRVPTSWADGTHAWDGWVAPEEYPRIVDPPSGRIWTANARVVDGAALAVVGDGGYDLGARARQIRDDIMAIDRAKESDMLGVQLDDRALFLARWRDLALRALTPGVVAKDARRGEFRRLVEGWGARAAVDSAGYRLVRSFRQSVAEDALDALTAPCREADARHTYRTAQYEGPLWTLVSAQPPHLLSPRYATWDDLLVAGVDRAIGRLLKDGGTLAQRTWGERNSPRVGHPLSAGIPFLQSVLDMPRHPIPGDSNMPRVQDRVEGASERLSVSPGREAEGLFQMPGGQSGHPLSPHYSDGHADWIEGRPTSFLPGPVRYTLTLVPLAR